MEKYMTPPEMVSAAEDIDRIASALGVSNAASLLVSFPNGEPNPPYRIEKASLAVQETKKLMTDLEEDPQRFKLEPITAALTITLLKRATRELRAATDNWIDKLGPTHDWPDSWT